MSKPARTRKCQLDALLAERGIFESAQEARPWIMTGQVLVNEQLIDKPGMLVPRDAALRIRGRHRYVSRGGYKLEAAIERFRVNVAGRGANSALAPRPGPRPSSILPPADAVGVGGGRDRRPGQSPTGAPAAIQCR